MQKELNQPYILTQDTKSILGILDGNLPISFDSRIDQYLAELSQAISLAYPEIITYQEAEMQEQLGIKVTDLLTKNQQRVCLCLDRFLLKDIEANFPDRFTRLAITRTAAGSKAPRQGNLPIAEQFQLVSLFIKDRPVIIADDGLFSGSTVQFVLDKLYQSGLQKNQVEKIIAFIGNSQILKVNGIPVELIEDIPNLYEWIDIRDFGIFGGKQLTSGKNNRVSVTIPYLFPWSMGESASLDKNGQLFNVSKAMICSFISLLADFETARGKPLTFRDLIKSGFPLPTNQSKSILVSINTDPKIYLENCLQMIETEQQREVIVFDMDGTLYQLDGNNCSYTGSTLERKILENCLEFISQKERIKPEQTETVMNQGLQDRIGLSNFLAQRYSITRKQYFDAVWNIDPRGMIFNYQEPVRTILRLAQTKKKLILLTSAPQIWQRRVTDFLGISQYFESVYSGEDFGQKEEIFSILAQRYSPGKILSIGDQEEMDIQPAAALGCKTFLVQNPNDFRRLNL